MRIVVRMGLLLLQLVAFACLTLLFAQAHTYLTSETYTPGTTPNHRFPVVAVNRAKSPSANMQYELLRWSDIGKSRPAASQSSFKLPEAKGGFSLPVEGDYQPFVDFKVLETTGDRQRIEVTLHDEDYVFYSKYSTDGASVRPEYLRTFGFASTAIAIVPAIIATWLLGRVIAWQWKRRSRAERPISG